MNILMIANNVNGNTDGVGIHARLVSEEFERKGHDVTLLSAYSGHHHIASFFTLKMTVVFIKAIVKTLFNNYHYITIEYPFKEHNPIILIVYIALYYIGHIRKTNIALSLHEYDRVNSLRKKVIDVFLKYCDIVFVSENKYFERFSYMRDKVFLRIIPSQIISKHEIKEFNKKEYAYFGLVNHSKAFQEMLDAWRIFNSKGDKTLHIMTSTSLENFNLQEYPGIKYHQNLDGEKISEILFNCSFSIIPVKPHIGMLNTSFTSSIQCGCIPIGIFNDELSEKEFIINMTGYDLQEFVTTLKRSQEINTESFFLLSRKAMEMGKDFSFEKTYQQMMVAFNLVQL